MGRPVIHFEVVATDYERSRAYFAELFGWEPRADNPMGYGVIDREDNLTADGVGIGGGIGPAPAGYAGHVTFYVEVPDVAETLAAAERMGGSRVMGPEEVMEGLVIGLATDPDGHVIGVIQAPAA